MASFTLKRNSFAEEQMRVHAEEVAAWLPGALGLPEGAIKAEEDGSHLERLFESLSDGIWLCQLVERVSPASHWPPGADRPEPDIKCPFDPKAAPGSFKARDNVTKFLEACKKLGLRDVQLFTTEDLISRRNPKQVVNTLLDLARIGAQNGLAPPQIVQYERELDAARSDSEDEEREVFVAEQFGMSREELSAVERVFAELVGDDALVVTRHGLARALQSDAEVARLRAARPEFDRLFRHADVDDGSGGVALDEWLRWFRNPDKPAPKGESAPAGEAAAPAAPAAPAPAAAQAHPQGARPRLGSVPRKEFAFEYLPYVPHPEDPIDAALAEEVNANQLDIRIRRIAVQSKKKAKALEGCYRIGKGSQPKVFMRLVRGLLMVRVGNSWEGVVRYLQRALAEQFAHP